MLVSVVPLGLMLGLYVFTHAYALRIEALFPPTGQYIDVGGYKLHYVDIAAGENADLPPIVFIHGASGNVRDQQLAFEQPLKGRARMIFVDRPGHGYSDRGPDENRDPSAQAAAIATLLEKLDVPQAIIVGHSYGAAVAVAFAVHYPDRVKGLVFLAPASHPWPGGVSWYYDLAVVPYFGYLFTELAALPAGLWKMKSGIESVFSPNTPPQIYFDQVGSELVLRPQNFRNNARDVTYLHQSVTRLSPRYTEIKKPTVIITGDEDAIVLAYIHSKGLEKDIAGARLITLKNIGHKPDYAANKAAIEAIEFVAR